MYCIYKNRILTICIIMFVFFSFLPIQADAEEGKSQATGQSVNKKSLQQLPQKDRMHDYWSGMRRHWRRVPRSLKGKIYMWERFFVGTRKYLSLSESQSDQIRSALSEQRNSAISKNAKRRIMLMEIQDLLIKGPVNMKEMESKVRSVEALYGDMVIDEINTLEKCLSILNPDQQKHARDYMYESTYEGWIMRY